MGILKYSLSVLNSLESLFCQKSPREWRVGVILAFVRWCSMIAMAIETLAGRLEHDEKQWLLSRGDGEPSSVHRRVRPRSLDPPKKNVARPSRQSFRRTIGVLSVLETNAASVSTIVRHSSYYHGYLRFSVWGKNSLRLWSRYCT